MTSIYKTNVKCRNTLSCQDKYTAPNSKHTGGECPHRPAASVGECPTHPPPPTPTCKWVPPPLKMCYQALKNKTNAPMKTLEWVKYGLCIYSGGYMCIYSGGETRHAWNLDFEIKLDLEVKVNCPPHHYWHTDRQTDTHKDAGANNTWNQNWLQLITHPCPNFNGWCQDMDNWSHPTANTRLYSRTSL